MTCFDISDDNVLIAGGFMTSYIRIWTLDGTNLPRSGPEFDNIPDANSRRLIGHSGPIYSVAFPPCASARENVSAEDRIYTGPSWLLSSSADKSIRLWNLDAWQCIALYKGHDRPVWDLSWGPYGHYFVSGGSDNTARLWVSDHIRQQRIFAGHDQDVEVVCFHPNSAYVFTASCDHTVRMWAVTTGNAVRMFTGGHTGNITAMECSRDGKILASADDHGIITLWDLAPGRILKRMRGHAKGGIWSLSWSVESTVLVSGGADGTVRIWDVAGPQETGRVLEVSGAGKLLDAGPAPTGQSKKKKGKETVITPDQIVAFPTKKTPVYKVKFTNMNLVLAAGCFQPS
jgi:transcription initiation factor TFIID subunit 5